MTDPDDRATRLALLATALAGRRIDVAFAAAGTPSWTDRLTVFLDSALAPREQIQVIAVQSGLLRAGSLDPAVAAALARRPEVTARYLAIEGRRVLLANDVPLPPAVLALARPLDHETDSPAASLAVAEGRAPVERAPSLFGQIRPRDLRQPPGDLQAPGAGVRSAPEAQAPRELKELVDDALGEDHGQDLSSPVGGGGAIGKLLQRLTTAARSRSSGSPGADAATHTVRPGRRVGARSVARGAAVAEITGVPAAAAVTYPEWDTHRGSYRYGWCTVNQRAVLAQHVTALPVPHTRAVRRALSRIGLELAATRRQLQGDDIDVDAAVSQRVDIAAGTTPDETVYVDSQRRRRELSALILLDVSGSAGEPSATGVPVHDHQRSAAAMLTFALHQLGDRVALQSFRSMGRANVEVTPLKRFDEAADAGLLRRLAALTPGAYTRLGAAIRHGTAVLERDAGTGQRLLVVISDGFAYDHGYEGRYAEADARRALIEARRSGIGCLCLSVGGVTESAELRRVFGTAAHATLHDVTDLPTFARSLFTAALRSADTNRRQWRRADRSRSRLLVDRRSA